MSLGNKLLYSYFFSCFVFILFLFLLKTLPVQPQVLPISQQAQTVPSVTARVGEYQIGILSGYASPYAEVHLNGQGTSRKTISDNTGYFEFKMFPIRKKYGEFCLTSIDVQQRPTLPLCLAPITGGENIEIIGILLPPSLSLDKGSFLTGETAKASGMTFPGTGVDIYLFENYKGGNLLKKIVSPVFAAGLPKYSIRSNKEGYFEFSLPNAISSENRLFSVSYLEYYKNIEVLKNLISPKSNTLSFLVYKPISPWYGLIILAILVFLFAFRKKRRPTALLILQNKMVKTLPLCNTNLDSLGNLIPTNKLKPSGKIN